MDDSKKKILVSAKCGIVSLVGFVIALVFGRYF